MSFLKSHGLDLELLAARAGRLSPRGKRKADDAERELERRQAEERRAALERASRNRED